MVCPRQMRIASTTLGWAIAEMTAALPPHFLHRRTSSRKTRIISSDPVSLLSRRLTGSPEVTSKIGTVATEGPGQPALQGGGFVPAQLWALLEPAHGARSRTTTLRHLAPGARTP